MSTVPDDAPDDEPRRDMRDGALAALHALGGDARVDSILKWVQANGPVAPSHELLAALTSLRREGLVRDLPCARWALADNRLAELRAMALEDYLQTPEWLRMRAAALERAGACCRVEARHRENLDVHHRSHERLGAELDADLIVLCRSCHVLYHRAYGLAPRKEPVADVVESQPTPTIRPSRRLVPARLSFR